MFGLITANETNKVMSFRNDKQDKVLKMTTAEFLASTGRERKAWEDSVYVEANKKLYAVLARCNAFVMDDSSKAGVIARGNAMKAFYAQRIYASRQATQLTGRVVHAVFGNVERRSMSTYSIVIRKAQKLGVAMKDFAIWIEAEGGVQEVRLGRSETYVSKKDKAGALATQWTNMHTMGIAEDEKRRMQRQRNNDGKHCLLAAVQNKDGTYAIKGVIHTQGIVKQAMAALQSAKNTVEMEVAREKEVLDKQAANDA